MFENLLYQGISAQLSRDIEAGVFAPAVLFSGPQASGKGTAALELARVLSCEADSGRGIWNCSCPSCMRHRNLVSRDTLLLGQKPFYAEIAACGHAWNSEPGAGTRRLFVRSVRKLLSRFSPVLWEDDAKLGKIAALLAGIEEELDTFERAAEKDNGKAEEARAAILKNALKLESEGMGELIPIALIRKAAYWSRLAPAGRRKCLIIENADRMQDGAKNSLLKILEEPPDRVTIVLTCVRPGTLLPTMLSRLRHYRFVQRNMEEEAEVIRRIFRGGKTDEQNQVPGGTDSSHILAYLESFLPVDKRTLYPLAAYFAASAAAAALRALKVRGGASPETAALISLGKFSAPVSEEGGMGRPAPDFRTARAQIFKNAEKFEIPGLFSNFCKNIMALLSSWLRTQDEPENGMDGAGLQAHKARIAEVWKTELDSAFTAVDTYNIQTALVFERLGENLKNALTR
jgi:DNA polymerase-3 subunit gamma/tau